MSGNREQSSSFGTYPREEFLEIPQEPIMRAALLHGLVADRVSCSVKQWFDIPQRDDDSPIFSSVIPTLQYMYDRAGLSKEVGHWQESMKYFMKKISDRASIASYQLSGMWFDGPADLLDANKQHSIDKLTSRLNGDPKNDIMIAKASRNGQAAYVKRYYRPQLDEYKE